MDGRNTPLDACPIDFKHVHPSGSKDVSFIFCFFVCVWVPSEDVDFICNNYIVVNEPIYIVKHAY